MGTSGLGYLLLFTVPTGVVMLRILRAEPGQRVNEVQRQWRGELRELFLVTAFVGVVVFLWEFLYDQPRQIFREGAAVEAPLPHWRTPLVPPNFIDYDPQPPLPAPLSDDEIEARKWLARFPLGFAIFDIDTVTNNCIPRLVRSGNGRHFNFGFQTAKVLENDSQRVTLQLPELWSDGRRLIGAGTASGDPRTMEAYGGGYGYGLENGDGISLYVQVLSYEGPTSMKWVIGLTRFVGPPDGGNSPNTVVR